MTFERRTEVVPSYDCRVVCEHKIKAPGRDGHGIHNEEWIYVLIDRSVGALQLRVHTGRYPATVDVRQLHDYGDGFKGAFLSMCTPFVTDLELVRNATAPGECGYLGRCHHYGTWYLHADEMVKEHFFQSVQTIEDAQPRLWKALAEFFQEAANRIEIARHESGDLGWHRCAHCAGAGVLPGALS